MNSDKSRKMNIAVVRIAVAVGGVLLFSFQNCSRVDTMQISDLANKATKTNEVAGGANNDQEVFIQIQQENGTTINVDSQGNETVVNNDTPAQPPVTAQPLPSNPQIPDEPHTQPLPIDPNGRDIVASDDDDDHLDLCIPEEQIKDSKMATVSSFQKIKCKKRKDRRPHEEKRCMDMIRENGVTVIDLARLDNVTMIKSQIKGKTIIYSSDPSKSASRSLVIEHAVGKTILCGIAVTRLDIKKGNLELREGASVKSCGEIKGHIYKDEKSSIDGSRSE